MRCSKCGKFVEHTGARRSFIVEFWKIICLRCANPDSTPLHLSLKGRTDEPRD